MMAAQLVHVGAWQRCVDSCSIQAWWCDCTAYNFYCNVRTAATP